jgi:Ni/Fe-hydrogenase subunit HybB-like protein
MLGFVLLPSFLFAVAVRRADVRLARLAGVLTVLGVLLNRFNVSLIAFNWTLPNRYVPAPAEVLISLTIVTLGVIVFRWIVSRMPVLPTRRCARTDEAMNEPTHHSDGDRVLHRDGLPVL